MNNNRLEEKRNGGKKKELLYYIKNQAIRVATAMHNSVKDEKERFLSRAMMKVQQSPAVFSALGLSLGFLTLAGIIAAW